MSDLMKSVILWGAIILLLSYLFHLDLALIIQSVIHAIQNIHNSTGGSK